MSYIKYSNVDVHELMKKNLDLADGEHSEWRGNESANTFDQYLILDSFVKMRDSSTEFGEFKWILNTQNQTNDESVGLRDNVDNVVQLHIGPFYIPMLEDIQYDDPVVTSFGDLVLLTNNTTLSTPPNPVPPPIGPPTLIRNTAPTIGQYPSELFQPTDTYVLPWINNPLTQIPFCNRISVYIKETGLQSYSGYGNNRYNFEFTARFDTKLFINPNFLQLRSLTGDDWNTYGFLHPLRRLQTLTVVFKNPDKYIAFEPDIMYRSIINITPGPPPNGGIVFITTQFLHKLRAGDRIYIKNFAPAANFPLHITNYINRLDGHAINNILPVQAYDPAILLLDQFSFGLDPAIQVDTTNVDIASSFPGLADIYIAKRRIRIPIKITSIVQRKTSEVE